MKAKTPSQPSQRNTKPAAPSSPPAETKQGWIDRLGYVWLHYGRFSGDLAGILVSVLALVTLLGLLGLSAGELLGQWVRLLRFAFGWGAFLAVVFLVSLAALIFRRKPDNRLPVRMRQVVAAEFLGFTLITLLSLIGGVSLDRAADFLDGGVVGWGLARLITAVLPQGLAVALILLLSVWLILIALDLIKPFQKKLEQLAGLPSASSNIEKVSSAEAEPAWKDEADEPQSGSPFTLVRDERLPPIDVLNKETSIRPDEAFIREVAARIETTLAEFKVPARVIGYRVGPAVTQYAIEPGYIERPSPDGTIIPQKVRVAQISALSRDLARALSAERLRIEAPVPGRSFVGIEIPNRDVAVVHLRSILESEAFQKMGAPLGIALGRDVSGQPVVADLARMPHLLIAGTTGSGKSVCIAAITTCLVMNNPPEHLRLALLDPKMVELIRFNGLPHLLGQVETSIERMLAVLRWALQEMDRRYRVLEEAKARDLDAYNQKMLRRKQPLLPRIVIIIDELADLMMSAPDQTEHALVRLAQMARATGIHLILATQRPSTDVLTGLIKANFPARVSFTVATSIDSRVILDSNGAETLLGRGDMLFLDPEVGSPKRSQGVLVTDLEIERVISHWQAKQPQNEVEAPPWEDLLSDDAESADALLEAATEIVRKSQRASASLLQRKLRIGYPRAARLIDELEAAGIIGPNLGAGREREVLIPPDEEENSAPDEGE